MNNNGKLIVISGFSGAGKGTVIKHLLGEYSNYVLSISATTRKPRTGEVHGREYFFKTVDEFKAMIANDELVEYAQYVENYYGTPKEYVDTCLNEGKNVILEIEIQGALNIKKKFPQAVLIFITPPSADELKARLINRGTEDIDTIMARLRRAKEEAEGVENYDYIIVNDIVDKCAQDINSVIVAECSKSGYKLDIIDTIKERLEDI